MLVVLDFPCRALVLVLGPNPSTVWDFSRENTRRAVRGTALGELWSDLTTATHYFDHIQRHLRILLACETDELVCGFFGCEMGGQGVSMYALDSRTAIAATVQQSVPGEAFLQQATHQDPNFPAKDCCRFLQLLTSRHYR